MFHTCSGKNLKRPQSVAYSISGDIIVIDQMKITLCTEKGDFVSIGSSGLNGPLGLAVDKLNNLIVCDSNAGRLQVFTLEGRYITTITGFGSPQFIAVSKDGQLYVADRKKKCVHVLQ
ncbi:hypothetical protein ACROYT_G000063 [Oculina patagonica]